MLLLLAQSALAQMPDTTQATSIATDTLREVSVTAYGQARRWQQTPAAVNMTGAEERARYSNNTVLQAINSAPGVRMEERSPGSYRFSIRGSSLRSSFGVRNVKVYYHGIPITDPSGFSYFNQLGYYQLHQVQVIKGPGSSLYGAGTGGVLLVDAPQDTNYNGATLHYEGGSFNSHHIGSGLRIGDSLAHQTVRYDYNSSDGYREQSALRRHTASWDGYLQASPRLQLQAHILYTDLQYQTPGALTLAEYNANPRSARPAAGMFPGAVQNRAAIYQRSALVGAGGMYSINDYWQNSTIVYVNYTTLRNPTVRNYSSTQEPHAGGRTVFTYARTTALHTIRVLGGAEYQQGRISANTYTNSGGQPDSLLTEDRIHSAQLTGFLQGTWQWQRWLAEAGVSAHTANTMLMRTVPNSPEQSAGTGGIISPRLALLYALSPMSSVYANVSRGFSSPTTAEYFPTGSATNTVLRAETGWNYEIGVKGYAWQSRLRYEVNTYYFQLLNAIVLRRDAGGGDTYVNAGGTQQSGLEAALRYYIIRQPQRLQWNVWAAYTGSFFNYKNFQQLQENYSGRQLPGTPQHAVAAGMDVSAGKHWDGFATYYYADRIALNDANTAYATPYHLLGCKLQYTYAFPLITLSIYAGADNLLDQQYSLGNDLNAAAGRYYNAASGRSFYAGLSLQYR